MPPIDPSALGQKSQVHTFAYDWKTTALYALGIGAQANELGYLYEGRGPRVYPTFAVVPAMPALHECMARTGGDPEMIVHLSQSVELRRPIPAAGVLSTVGEVVGVYDMKKLAQIRVRTTTTGEDGAELFATEWGILVRGAGGFGGKPPPREADEAPVPKDRPADFTVEQVIPPTQALLYRLSGDHNPLHADPEFAARVGFTQGPILHGLCTYGFVARALIASRLGGDGDRLRSLDAQFRKPVWPGETLLTEGWDLGEGKVALRATVTGRPEAVLTGAWARVDR
jgi:acyl dehydratase